MEAIIRSFNNVVSSDQNPMSDFKKNNTKCGKMKEIEVFRDLTY
jgi:hypothetical protein